MWDPIILISLVNQPLVPRNKRLVNETNIDNDDNNNNYNYNYYCMQTKLTTTTNKINNNNNKQNYYCNNYKTDI